METAPGWPAWEAPDTVYLGLGSASAADADADPVAAIWLPTPAAADGWAAYPIYAPAPPPRPLGFARPSRTLSPRTVAGAPAPTAAPAPCNL